MMFSAFMLDTFDTEGSVVGVVCLVASVEVQSSFWGFHFARWCFESAHDFVKQNGAVPSPKQEKQSDT